MAEDTTKDAPRLLPGLLLAGAICVAALAAGIWAAMDGRAALVLDRVFAGLVALGMAIRAGVSAVEGWHALQDRDWRALAVAATACIVMAGLFVLALVYALPVPAPPPAPAP